MHDVRRPLSIRAAFGFLALLAGLILLVQLSAGEAGAAKGKKTKVDVEVTTKKQKSLLKKGALKVRLEANQATKVKVKAKAGKGKMFKGAKTKLEPKGSSSVKLKLTKKGEKRLSSCGGQKVTVTATFRDGGKQKEKDSRTLKRDKQRCDQPYTPVDTTNADRCDFLDPAVCLQPFPNDYFTVNDASTPTGKRLNLNRESMPKNIGGVGIDPTDMNRADGFSPGNMIIVKIPQVETPAAFQNSGIVPIDNLQAYDDPNQAVMVINAETGERQPIFAELDANPTSVDPGPNGPGGINENPGNTGPVNLIIRPAKNFDFGERYIVALRNLKDANNNPVEAPIGFRVYRDNDITDQPEVEARRPHMESIINDLVTKAGVQRDSLYMAWDFTVASQESVTGRAVTIRDDAFAELGDTNLANRTIEGVSPDFTIGTIDENPTNTNLTRIVNGTIDNIPCYLDNGNCATGGKFAFDANDQLTWNESSSTSAAFRCVIPASVENLNPGDVAPAAPGTYGHGLLGSYTQVNGQAALANQSNTLWCAVDWAGFANQDLPTVIPTLADMSNFNKLADRMQQGFVNFMYLGRALNHPDGMSDDPAFQFDPDGVGGEDPESAIATNGVNGRTQYMGISQGGIMGGALTALSPDADYGVLNVPGMNYSTLLRRSVDSDEYFKIPGLGLYSNYPNELERPLLLSLVQLLWDRGEGNGYAHNMTDNPLPNTPPHEVLLQPAVGDHQVANITAEIEARTIGAAVYTPAVLPNRHWEADPFYGLTEVNVPNTGPYMDSMLVYYDGGPVGYNGTNGGGSGVAPDENVPPRPEWGFGDDPHGYPRASADGREHAGDFLAGNGIGPCADPSGYCFSNGWDGTTP